MALSFIVESVESVQIVNNRNGHWLTVSTIERLPSTASATYNSMYHHYVGKHVKDKLYGHTNSGW